MSTPTTPPKWYWIISIVALIWNLMGVVAYFGQRMMTDEMIDALPEEQRPLYEDIPSWVTIAFAVAVFSGLIASICLLMKKRWAVPLFFISLLAILVQHSYGFLMTDYVEVMGVQAIFMPLFVILACIALLWFSRVAAARGWLF